MDAAPALNEGAIQSSGLSAEPRNRPPARSIDTPPEDRDRMSSAFRARVTLCVKVGLLLGCFSVIGWTRLDPDFGWHLRAGE